MEMQLKDNKIYGNKDKEGKRILRAGNGSKKN